MFVSYMTHPEHGVHIAYSKDEVERCKAHGWTEKPGEGAETDPPQKPKRGPYKKRKQRS